MAAPNIISLSIITGKTAMLAASTSATAVVSNGASSGKVQKVNSVIVANTTNVSADITIDIYRSSTAYRLAKAITVPTQATLVVIGKDSPFYLEEGDSLRATASTNSSLEVTVSYEELS